MPEGTKLIGPAGIAIPPTTTPALIHTPFQERDSAGPVALLSACLFFLGISKRSSPAENRQAMKDSSSSMPQLTARNAHSMGRSPVAIGKFAQTEAAPRVAAREGAETFRTRKSSSARRFHRSAGVDTGRRRSEQARVPGTVRFLLPIPDDSPISRRS